MAHSLKLEAKLQEVNKLMVLQKICDKCPIQLVSIFTFC